MRVLRREGCETRLADAGVAPACAKGKAERYETEKSTYSTVFTARYIAKPKRKDILLFTNSDFHFAFGPVSPTCVRVASRSDARVGAGRVHMSGRVSYTATGNLAAFPF